MHAHTQTCAHAQCASYCTPPQPLLPLGSVALSACLRSMCQAAPRQSVSHGNQSIALNVLQRRHAGDNNLDNNTNRPLRLQSRTAGIARHSNASPLLHGRHPADRHADVTDRRAWPESGGCPGKSICPVESLLGIPYSWKSHYRRN